MYILARNILSGTVSRGADGLRDCGHDRRGRFRPGRLGVLEARPKPIVRDEETEKKTNCRHAATGARVQREKHSGIVYQPVYWQVSIALSYRNVLSIASDDHYNLYDIETRIYLHGAHMTH